MKRGASAKNRCHLRRSGSHLEPLPGDPMEALGTSRAQILIKDFDGSRRVKLVPLLDLIEQSPRNKGKITNRNLNAQ